MLGEKILKYLEIKKISSRQFANLVGIDPSQINRYTSGSTDPTEKTLRKINKAIPNFDEIVNSNQQTEKSNATKLNGVNIMMVPVVSSYAYAGYLSGVSSPEYLEDLPTIPFLVDKEYKGRYVAFEVKGDSMDDGTYNSYLPGDIVLGREIQKLHWKNKLHINKWDFVIVHNISGILIKKIAAHNPETGDIIARSLNNMYDDIHLNLEDIHQLFNVVKVERTKK